MIVYGIVVMLIIMVAALPLLLGLLFVMPILAGAYYVAFRQVLTNLVENAVKYNEPGGHVEITARPRDTGDVRITVVDDGIDLTINRGPLWRYATGGLALILFLSDSSPTRTNKQPDVSDQRFTENSALTRQTRKSFP